jgi:hypothetical protein
MPDSGIANGAGFTSAFWDTYVRQQVVEQVTSATRPTGVDGREIVETDTDRELTYDGSNWIRTNWHGVAGRTVVRCRITANQAIINNLESDLSWTTEDTDTDGFIAVTGTTFTVPTGLGGIYAITMRATWASAIAQRNVAILNVTTAVTGAPASYHNGHWGEDQVTITTVLPLLAADTFKLSVYQLSGGSVNITTAWMQAIRLGA